MVSYQNNFKQMKQKVNNRLIPLSKLIEQDLYIRSNTLPVYYKTETEKQF